MDKKLYISPVVLAVIRNDEGKYLLTKRAMADEEDIPEFKDKWELPGGGVNFGESPEEAIKREIREEVGLDITNLHMLSFTFTKVRSPWHGLFLIFVCDMVDPEEPVTLNEESSGYAWMSYEEVYAVPTLPGVTDVFDYLEKRGKGNVGGKL